MWLVASLDGLCDMTVHRFLACCPSPSLSIIALLKCTCVDRVECELVCWIGAVVKCQSHKGLLLYIIIAVVYQDLYYTSP